MDSIAEHFGIKRYRSVAAVCAIYPDAQTAETHLYLKLTSFCVNILIVLFRSINISDCNFRSSSYNLNKCLVRKIYQALAENMRNQASIQSRATVGPAFEWRFSGRPIVARFYVLIVKWAGIGLTQPASNLVPLSASR